MADAGRYEQLAAIVLLAKESSLQRLWLCGDDGKVYKQHIDTLGLTDGFAKKLLEFMQKKKDLRHIFRGISQATSALYTGGEPHPDEKESIAIVAALRKLDGKKGRK